MNVKTKGMTPFPDEARPEAKPEDYYVLLTCRGFQEGEVVTLVENDNTKCPVFYSEGVKLRLRWEWLAPFPGSEVKP